MNDARCWDGAGLWRYAEKAVLIADPFQPELVVRKTMMLLPEINKNLCSLRQSAHKYEAGIPHDTGYDIFQEQVAMFTFENSEKQVLILVNLFEGLAWKFKARVQLLQFFLRYSHWGVGQDFGRYRALRVSVFYNNLTV